MVKHIYIYLEKGPCRWVEALLVTVCTKWNDRMTQHIRTQPWFKYQIVKGSMYEPKIVCLLFNYVYGLAFVRPCACGMACIRINVEITFRHFISDADSTFCWFKCSTSVTITTTSTAMHTYTHTHMHNKNNKKWLLT